jgi:alkylhydroperoxidase family enzyme
MTTHPADLDLAVIERIVERDTDAALVAMIRERVSNLLLVGPSPTEPTDARGRALATFVDQFVIDVSGIDDALRARMFEHLGGDALGFAQALYVLDLGIRRRIVIERLGPIAPLEVDGVDVPAELLLWPAIENYLRTVARMKALDPVTAELVRLRGAAAHQCRICKSRLSVQAVEALGSAEPFESIVASRPTELAPNHTAAVQFVDAVVTQPTGLDATLAATLHSFFSTEELHEMLHDVVRNSANKFAVAVGGDEAAVAEGIEFYDLDAEGDVIADIDADIVRAATRV